MQQLRVRDLESTTVDVLDVDGSTRVGYAFDFIGILFASLLLLTVPTERGDMVGSLTAEEWAIVTGPEVVSLSFRRENIRFASCVMVLTAQGCGMTKIPSAIMNAQGLRSLDVSSKQICLK
jgi:hypothetical protein